MPCHMCSWASYISLNHEESCSDGASHALLYVVVKQAMPCRICVPWASMSHGYLFKPCGGGASHALSYICSMGLAAAGISLKRNLVKWWSKFACRNCMLVG